MFGAERRPDVQRPGRAVLSHHLQPQAGSAALLLVLGLHREAQGAAFRQQLLLVGSGQLVDHTALHLRDQGGGGSHTKTLSLTAD